MGLDLYCGGVYMKMGSYSTVQRVRVRWILAYASYLEKEKKQGGGDTIQKLRSVVSSSSEEIDYDRFCQIPLEEEGLSRFVYHSDSDGSWTSEDASYIQETLNKIRDELRELEPFHFEEDGEYYLEELLEESVRTGGNISFC